MITPYKQKGITWIDLDSPTKEEVNEVRDTYDIHPSLLEDATAPLAYPPASAQCLENTAYIVVHVPVNKQARNGSREQEIKIYITPKAIVTIRYGTIEAVHRFAKEFEVMTLLKHTPKTNLSGYVLFLIMRMLYRSVQDELKYSRNQLKEIEENVFKGRERDMVFAISSASRTLLNFQQILNAHPGVFLSLASLSRESKALGGIHAWIEPILAEYRGIKDGMEEQVDLVRELRNTNDSLLSTKQNEIMKKLTIVATLGFPLTLITSFFNLSSEGTSFAGAPGGFVGMIVILSVTTAGLFFYFKRKHWI